MNSKIADAIRANDKKAYQEARYPKIQEGEWVVFINEDFSGVDFERFSASFFVFIRCKLDGAKGFYGQPVVMLECSARDLDLRGHRLTVYAHGCGFHDMKYNKDTQLVYRDKNNNNRIDASSSFVDCRCDDKTKQFLEKQGIFINTRHRDID